MNHDVDEDFSRQAQTRLQAFLDCVAYLMAKRWLQEQRQQEKQPPQQEGNKTDDEDR